MFLNTQIQTFGLDISDQSIKIAQIKKTRAGLQLTSYHQTVLPKGILVNGEIEAEKELIKYIKKTFAQSNHQIQGNYCVACLPEIKTFIKLIKIKLKDNNCPPKNSINELIKKCLPQHIPIPVEEVIFDWQIINKKPTYLEILIGVAPKNTVLSFNNLIKNCGLMPLALEIEAGAITRSVFRQSLDNFNNNKTANWLDKLKQINFQTKPIKGGQKINLKRINNFPHSKKIYFIIDFGASRSGLIAFADQTIKFTTSLNVSGNSLTEKISQDLKLAFKKAEKLKNIYGLEDKKNKGKIKKILTPLISNLSAEIFKAKEFYENNFEQNVKKYEIILTGGSANLKKIVTELSDQLNMKVSLANPLINLAPQQKIKINQQEIQSYSTAIGLALRSFFIKNQF